MGLCIGLKAEAIAEYKRVHAAVWPDVLEVISRANIRNYSIFLREPENLLFRLLGVSRQRFRPGCRANGRGGRDAENVTRAEKQAEESPARGSSSISPKWATDGETCLGRSGAAARR